MGTLIGVQLEDLNSYLKLLLLGTPVIFVILHSCITLSPVRGAFLLLLAAAVGFIAEFFGLKYGQFFGTFYTYRPQLTFFTVPVQVLLYWAVFIYIGYSMTNSFLLWLHIKKPLAKLHNGWLLMLTILIDGLLVLAIDLFMDPLEVRLGAWSWIQGGPYFGVPLGNFIGWFIVAILVSGIFRSIEYFIPIKKMKYDRSILIIPTLCYGLLACTFIGMAVQLTMYDVGIVGSICMIPPVLLNVYFYMRSTPFA